MTHPGQLLKQEKLYANKELGQNFLSNPGAARMIVEKTGISSKTRVLEIGSGLGALTTFIAQTAFHVTAVEKDSRIARVLKQIINKEDLQNITLINEDILKLDINKIAIDNDLVVIGNLPYNISSQVLFKLIKQRNCIKKAFLTFQKELAKRIIAQPGKRDYSRLSAVSQYAADISFVVDIDKSFFFPKPVVDSTILKFEFFNDQSLDKEQEKILFDVIKAGFSKRRKTLKNSLTIKEFGFTKDFISQILEKTGIDGTRRAETLNVNEFKALACAVQKIQKKSSLLQPTGEKRRGQ